MSILYSMLLMLGLRCQRRAWDRSYYTHIRWDTRFDRTAKREYSFFRTYKLARPEGVQRTFASWKMIYIFYMRAGSCFFWTYPSSSLGGLGLLENSEIKNKNKTKLIIK